MLAIFFKAIKQLYPQWDLWRQPPYEYEHERLPIDLLTGGDAFRKWVDDPKSTVKDFDQYLSSEEDKWTKERKAFLLY